jgi:hypothetical protein
MNGAKNSASIAYAAALIEAAVGLRIANFATARITTPIGLLVGVRR